MKNKTFFTLFIIVIIAFLFRIWHIDKPEGLWNDEYVSWYAASRDSFSEFISLISRNCHTPLYYCYLKLWLIFFPDTDISLRISSLAPSIAAVIMMFFAGRELKNEKMGILCAVLTALSSFYIYFAQEARLYSLLSLISAALMLSCITTLKSGKKQHFIIFVILNAVLCAVHTLGVIFSFFIIFFTLFYLYKNFENWNNALKNFKKILMYIFPLLCVLLIISPFLSAIVFSHNLSQFWSGFSLSKVLFCLTDYFSPVLINITNSPPSFSACLYNNGKLNFGFIFYAAVPAVIASAAVLKSVFLKDEKLNLLLSASLCFFGIILLLSASGRMILLTKYTSVIYPELILAFAAGLYSVKNLFFRRSFAAVYIGAALIYLYFSPVSAPKLGRPEGNRAPVLLIKQSSLKKGDFVIFTYYDYDKFERYLPDKNFYRISSISKFNFHDKIFGSKNYNEVINEGKTLYRNTFKEFPNKNAVNWVQSEVIQYMKEGDRAGIIFLEGVSFLSNETIKKITDDDIRYNKTPFIFLTFSALKNSLMYAFKEDFQMESITQAGDWTLIVYKKIR